MDVSGKTAVVTGGGRGIGRGISLALARNGADIVVADIIVDNAEGVAEEVRALGRRALPLSLDVTGQQSVETMTAQALAEFAGEVLERSTGRPGSLLLVGGDTAYACLRRLRIGAVALAGEAEPYVPWGRAVGGRWAGSAVISKAGGFGDPGTLRRIRFRLLSPFG